MRPAGTSPEPLDQSWDRLHSQPRFRPRYPSESVIRFVMRHLGDSAASSRIVLDLGAGAGRHSVLVSDLGHRVVAVDYSATGLLHTQAALRERRGGGVVVRGTMTRLPLASNSVDAAIAFGVLLYSDRRGYEAALAELLRVLKAGAHLLVVTRTTRDGRFGRGTQTEPNTFVLTDDTTNERGMPMHFVDRAEIDELFAGYTEVSVDWIDHTTDSGAFLNSDWVIDARKPL